MTCTPEELAQRDRLEDSYVLAQSPTMLTIERSVCGCDFGGTSWTTRTQAEQLITQLDLNVRSQLLDLGAGSGWPGLYLAQQTGCQVTLVDLPVSGLQIAEKRARQDGIAGQLTTVNVSATDLPFPSNSFNAISHSDLLCCLVEKQSVLSSCRRVINPLGCMAFTVISVVPDLSDTQRLHAVENGPEFVESATSYQDMLDATGWLVTSRQDVTAAFCETMQRQLDADIAHRESLETLLDSDAVEERILMWQSKLSAVQDGLLRREVFVVRPDRARSG